MTDNISFIFTAQAAVTALDAMDADSPAFHAENGRVRALVEAAYQLPVATAAEKAAVACLVLAYEGDGIEPAVVHALRSIAA